MENKMYFVKAFNGVYMGKYGWTSEKFAEKFDYETAQEIVKVYKNGQIVECS